MKEEIKKRWVEALRSGDYNQGKNALRAETITGVDRFCCLGILCDLHSKDTGIKWEETKEFTGNKPYIDETGKLPNDVMLWAGLEKPFPHTEGDEYTLAYRNDNGTTFHEIANAIEKGL